MSSIGPGRIRFGVVGLGRTWAARFRPAVLALRDRFGVSAVLDPVAARAEAEARSLRCAACTGLAALVDRPDVDAVALLAPQWFGLLPAELAARAGKPIYLGVPLPDDPGELDRLDAAIRASGVPVFWETTLRHDPTTIVLRDQLAQSSRPLDRIQLQILVQPFDRALAPALFTQDHPVAVHADPGLAAVDWCRLLMGDAVQGILRWDTRPGLMAIYLDFGSKLPIQLTLSTLPEGAATRGTAAASHGIVYSADRVGHVYWPGGIGWSDGPKVSPIPVLPGPPIGEVLLDQFARLLDGREHSAATWDDALASARVFAALRLVEAERTWFDLDGRITPRAPAAGSTP